MKTHIIIQTLLWQISRIQNNLKHNTLKQVFIRSTANKKFQYAQHYLVHIYIEEINERNQPQGRESLVLKLRKLSNYDKIKEVGADLFIWFEEVLIHETEENASFWCKLLRKINTISNYISHVICMQRNNSYFDQHRLCDLCWIIVDEHTQQRKYVSVIFVTFVSHSLKLKFEFWA